MPTAKNPKVTWWQRRTTVGVRIACKGSKGEPSLKMCSESELFVSWGSYELHGEWCALLRR